MVDHASSSPHPSARRAHPSGAARPQPRRLFLADEDFLAYREWLGEALKKTGCALHAYVLMTNHVHLLLTPPSSEAVAQLVIALGRRYVQYIKRRTAPCSAANSTKMRWLISAWR